MRQTDRGERETERDRDRERGERGERERERRETERWQRDAVTFIAMSATRSSSSTSFFPNALLPSLWVARLNSDKELCCRG
jgi:hypothetical protein